MTSAELSERAIALSAEMLEALGRGDLTAYDRLDAELEQLLLASAVLVVTEAAAAVDRERLRRRQLRGIA